MITDNPITKKSLDFAFGLSWGAIPDKAVSMTRKYVFDLMASALAGTKSEKTRAVYAAARAYAGKGDTPAFGSKELFSIRDAALINGAAGHALETDDSDRTGLSHPGVMVITPALLTAFKRHKSGKDFIRACVAGYEVMLRIGTALGLPHYDIWHTTSTSGVFGAVISSGLLYDLSRTELGHAFGNAGSLAGGLWEFNRTRALSKILHVGAGASNALLCVHLAKEGFTGTDLVLEGDQGLFAGYGRRDADFSVFDDYGKFWRSEGVSFKPYPCCRHTHGGIDCGIDLHGKIPAEKVKYIDSVSIETYRAAYQVVSSNTVRTSADAKFSLPYCVLRALLDGEITEKSFSPESFSEEAIQALLKKTGVKTAQDIQAVHPFHEECRVTVAMADGKSFTAFVADPLGEPENPVGWDGLKVKARDEIGGLMTEAEFDYLYDACRRLEDIPDMADFYHNLQKASVK